MEKEMGGRGTKSPKRPLASNREPAGDTIIPLAVPGGPAALVVAHPGHELRVHGWLEVVGPSVFVLTDGSGRSGQSRLGSTTRCLARAGAELGSIYGRLTDLALYAAILNHNFNLFIRLADELADALVRGRIRYVAGDADEGYNPAHDVCRLIIGAAVEMANRAVGHRIANFDFVVTGRPDTCPEELRPQAIWLELDESAFARKAAAARGFPELAAQVDDTLREIGVEAFRVECLRPVDNRAGYGGPPEQPPFYERYGEQQVAAGHYERVLRYRGHVVPLAEALWRYVEGTG